MIPLAHYLWVAALLFAIGILGILLNRHNIILLLMCLELMLLAVNINFVAFAHEYQQVAGQIVVFFILTVAAAEAAIGLALVVLLFRKQGNIDVSQLNQLKG